MSHINNLSFGKALFSLAENQPYSFPPQAKFDHDMPCETESKINLVDLAGR